MTDQPARPVIAQLGDMLPITAAAPLLRAIGKAAERLGYTDVCVDNAFRVTATPPTDGIKIDEDDE